MLMTAANPPLHLDHLQAFIEQQMALSPSPGLSAAVMSDGKIVFAEGFGYADPAQGRKASPHDRYWIASITKTFTSSLILKLIEGHKLRLDEDLAEAYPGIPKTWSKITIHQLLTHTSGIPNYTAQKWFGPEISKPLDRKALYQKLARQRLDFRPGSKYEYSNSNYMILADIAAKGFGMSFTDAVTKELAEPLGLASVGLMSSPSTDTAKGYVLTDGKFKPASPIDPSVPYGAGDLQATASDLLKWIDSYCQGEVVSKEMVAKAFERVKVGGKAQSYGLGWVVMAVGGLKAVGHEGQINGFTTDFIDIPSRRLAVAVLSNSEGFDAQAMAMAILHEAAPDLGAVAIEDKHPDRTASLKRFLVALLGGRLDKSACSATMVKVLNPTTTAAVFMGVTASTIESMILIEDSKDGRRCVFEMQNGTQRDRLLLTFDGKGILIGLMVRPD